MSKANQIEVIVSGEHFLMTKDEFSCFKYLDTMVQDIHPETPIEFDAINSDIFKILLEFVQLKFKPSKQNWKDEYFSKYQMIIPTIFQCAQFLDMPELQEDSKKEILKKINQCKSSEEMIKKLNINYNLTAEKSKEIFEKLSWSEL